MKADRVIGCGACGKPSALVGDGIALDGLCPWCRSEMSPGIARLYLRARIVEALPLIFQTERALRAFSFAMLQIVHNGLFDIRDFGDADMLPTQETR